jgi:hypothetical protein
VPFLPLLAKHNVRPWEIDLLTYADFVTLKSAFLAEGGV